MKFLRYFLISLLISTCTVHQTYNYTIESSEELEKIKLEKGNNIRCIISFVIQRNDINSFQASNLDPIYKKAFKKAINNGVEVIPIIIEWTKTGEAYFINRDIPVFL